MSFNQWTKCVSPGDYTDQNGFVQAAISGIITGAVAAAIVAGWCSFFAIPVTIAATTVAYCNWWLYGRLVCLGGDRSAVGMLVSVEPPSEKHDFLGELDSDYSINLLLYPNLPSLTEQVTQVVAEALPPYGELIKEQAGTKGRGLKFRGEFAKMPSTVDPNPNPNYAVLHAEFEGAGISDMKTGAEVSLGFAIAALIACALIPPPWGWVVAAILAFLAFLAWLFGYIVGEGDYAAPSDTSGTPSELHTNDPTTHFGAFLLYVQGTWVYDSAHEGWNEIHPIKVCTKVGEWTEDGWPADIPTIVGKLDDGFAEANDPATKDRQGDPRHDWRVHPLIDGCGDDEDPGPKPDPDPIH